MNDLWFYEIDFAKWSHSSMGLTDGDHPPAMIKSCSIVLGEFPGRVVIFGGRDEASKQSDKAFSFSNQDQFIGFGVVVTKKL